MTPSSPTGASTTGPRRPARSSRATAPRLRAAAPVLAVLAALAVLLSVAPPAAAAPPDPSSDRLAEEIDALLDQHVGTTTPGAMVAVVGADGEILTRTEGWADPLAHSPLTPQSRTPVASVSKVVTGLTALRLQHEGLLDLEADVREVLPVIDRRGEAVRTPVTGRHLLTHHAGLREPLLIHPEPTHPPEGGLRGVLEATPPVLAHAPDIGLHYSPLRAHTVLGAMIEDATGQTFDRAAARWVLDPVGAHAAGFDQGAAAEGDVALMGRDAQGWAATPWPVLAEQPAATLSWSTQDAAALLEALVTEDGGLPAAVVEEATTVAVRPAHGGGGHTQVLFEGWRAGVPVLEHAGANGLAWLALVPEADIGVFAAVTTEDPQAAAFTDGVLEIVADWTARTGRAERAPMPGTGLATIVPPWATPPRPADPAGTFQQRLFSGQGPELLLRTLTGQVTVTRDGPDLLLDQRRLAPAPEAGRWCDGEGCVAAVAAADGTVTLLRSDRAMLEQTLASAPWWSEQRFVLAAVGGTVLAALLALAGGVRARWRRRRGTAPDPAVSRSVALAWTLMSLALVVATALLPLTVLTGQSMGWIRAEGPTIWALRLATLGQLLLGAAWVLHLPARWGRLARWRRPLVPPALALGAAMSVVLVSWALPSV